MVIRATVRSTVNRILLAGGKAADRDDKTISAFRYRLDKLCPVDTLAERLAEDRDILGKVVFLDKTVRPDAFHYFFFRKDMPAVLDQQEQRIERFRSKRYRRLPVKKQPLGRIDTKTPEFVDIPGPSFIFRSLRIFSEKLHNFLKIRRIRAG